MKRASFAVAKALKEAGYPQESDRFYYNTLGGLTEFPYVGGCHHGYRAPTYLDAWLWLWREKGIYIDIAHYCSSDEVTIWDKKYNKIKSIDCFGKYQDPEEAIIAAIKCLVEQKLLK